MEIYQSYVSLYTFVITIINCYNIELLEFIGYNVIIMVVDSVYKTAYFIPTHTIITIESTIRLFLYHI